MSKRAICLVVGIFLSVGTMDGAKKKKKADKPKAYLVEEQKVPAKMRSLEEELRQRGSLVDRIQALEERLFPVEHRINLGVRTRALEAADKARYQEIRSLQYAVSELQWERHYCVTAASAVALGVMAQAAYLKGLCVIL